MNHILDDLKSEMLTRFTAANNASSRARRVMENTEYEDGTPLADMIKANIREADEFTEALYRIWKSI